MAGRYQFNKDETKTKLIQLWKESHTVLSWNTLWTYTVCSNMTEKH